MAGLPKDANIGASVLSQATQAIFGPAAQIFLAIMVTVTCFTTTAGLIVATGEFFHKAFPKVSYKAYAIIFTLIGFAIANLGLNNIIAFSVPVAFDSLSNHDYDCHDCNCQQVRGLVQTRYADYSCRSHADCFAQRSWHPVQACRTKCPY